MNDTRRSSPIKQLQATFHPPGGGAQQRQQELLGLTKNLGERQ